jgi:hypothetical protein
VLIEVVDIEATEPLRVRFECTAGEGIAEWGSRDVSVSVGDLVHVEMNCEGPVRWAADGSLTTTEAGRCKLRGTVEEPVRNDPLVILRVSTGLICVEMYDGEPAPTVGSEVVLKNAALSVWPYNY